MEKPISKAELRAAAELTAASMLERLPPPSACDHVFTPAFEAKMTALCQRAHRKEQVKKVWQRAAMIALATLLAVSAWLTVDAQAREKVVSWVRERIQGTTIYHFFGGDSEKPLPDYELTWLPEGFELLEHERELGDAWDYVFYTNPTTGKSIVFTCYRLDDFQMLALFGEGSELENKETVYVNGIAADYYPDPSDVPTNNLIWVDETYSALMTIDSDLSKDVILHIAEGVILSDPTKIK